jgi:2-polyprenyl-3-methyl-5-hydroxy-6-metoxy-1,4-benzoquinol methylase
MDYAKTNYKSKGDEYFGNVRLEVLPLLPFFSERIFEVGCGCGDTLAFLKSSRKCQWVGGIELFHDAAEIAKGKIDLLIEGNIESCAMPFEEKYFDVILCLDVLEHLVDPWSAVNNLHRFLKPGGVLICSIPNVKNMSVLVPLLFRGHWEYSAKGILDKTHLRFFTKKTAIDLASCSGLSVDMVLSTGLEKGRKSAFWNLLTLGLFKSFFEFQYLIRAVNDQ